MPWAAQWEGYNILRLARCFPPQQAVLAGGPDCFGAFFNKLLAQLSCKDPGRLGWDLIPYSDFEQNLIIPRHFAPSYLPQLLDQPLGKARVCEGFDCGHVSP